MMTAGKWTVTYRGFLQTITRTFPTHTRAVQWARQVGVYKVARIEGPKTRIIET